MSGTFSVVTKLKNESSEYNTFLQKRKVASWMSFVVKLKMLVFLLAGIVTVILTVLTGRMRMHAVRLLFYICILMILR